MKYFLAAFNNCIKFEGRARRSEFWFFTLYSYIIYLFVRFADITVLTYTYFFVMLLPAVAVSTRRMHDVDKSWWFFLVPVFNLVLALTPGDVGENRFGADPKNDMLFDASHYKSPFDDDASS